VNKKHAPFNYFLFAILAHIIISSHTKAEDVCVSIDISFRSDEERSQICMEACKKYKPFYLWLGQWNGPTTTTHCPPGESECGCGPDPEKGCNFRQKLCAKSGHCYHFTTSEAQHQCAQGRRDNPAVNCYNACKIEQQMEACGKFDPCIPPPRPTL